MKVLDSIPLYDKLLKKIYAYYQTIWKEKWKEGIEQNWLTNFIHTDEDEQAKEKVNMLYLLSKFMYFGNDELRQLLVSLYRDLFKYPIVASIRSSNSDTIDLTFIDKEYREELSKTRFLGVGNPSESGVHMLYFFRQECNLSKEFFINTSDIFSTSKITDTLPGGSTRTYLKAELSDTDIRRYIFIDDFCGSGSQASGYLKDIVENIKFEDPAVQVSYLMLFGTEKGIKAVRDLGVFDTVEAVYTIDETFKVFSADSRYFKVIPDAVIEKTFSEATALKYGNTLFGRHPLGYGDCQLLLGFHHNTPDNSLPIFWSNRNSWKPIFKRYNKIY